jgi:hypothetical protein
LRTDVPLDTEDFCFGQITFSVVTVVRHIQSLLNKLREKISSENQKEKKKKTHITIQKNQRACH